MSGLECSEIKLSQAISNTGEPRFDSEFYKKLFLFNQDLLQKRVTQKFASYCKFVKKGIFDLSPSLYLCDGIPLIRTSEIKNCLVDFSNTAYISQDVQKQNIKTCLHAGDLVFTKIGAYIGDVAVLPQCYSEYNFSQNVAGAMITNKFNSAFLLLFFLSNIGKLQIVRSAMLSGQGKLELQEIRNYEIPVVSDQIKTICNKALTKAESLQLSANKLYYEAEELLLSALDLETFTPSLQNTSIKSFSQFVKNGRLDAEYYQQKYDDIDIKVKSYKKGYTSIAKCFDLVKESFDKQKESYPYIEIGDINIGEANASFHVLSTPDLPDNAKIKVQDGDILVSKVRPNRGAVIIVPPIPDLIVSGAFCVLRSKGCYSSETLLVLLKSKIYREWLLKWNVGTSYPVIKDCDVLNLPLPLVPEEIQQEIADIIRNSFALREQSKALLKTATRAVEIAIEQDEATGIKYLEEHS